jgi:hypothetical protein
MQVLASETHLEYLCIFINIRVVNSDDTTSMFNGLLNMFCSF